jgi:hypothetical protein
MIISLLSDPSVMNEKNFAEGYNVLTGKVENHPANNKYGEVHSGDACLREWDSLCCSSGTGLSDIEDDLSDVSPFI